MKQEIIDKIHFLNHEIEVSNHILDRANKRKEDYIKSLINSAPFKKGENVSYQDKDYQIIDISLVERYPGIPDTEDIELVYRLQRIHSYWDIISVFETNVKYMTKI